MALTNKLTAIADVIRAKTKTEEGIPFADFAERIREIEVLRKATMHPNGLDANYYGYQAMNAAASYYLARKAGTDTFVYSNATLFSDDDGYNDNDGAADRWVRDADGNAKLDCSTFVGLALRGIPYEKSPFITHTGAKAKWEPNKELDGMYGTDGWEFRLLDRQPYDVYSGIGIPNQTTIRFASDFAEFFYKYGYVIYDAETDGDPTENLKDRLRPGDLLFWSSPSEDDVRVNLFRQVTHVAIVSRNPGKYYEVGSSGGVVKYSELNTGDSTLVLVCRPDYNISGDHGGYDINLISYPWYFSAEPVYTDTTSGLTVETTGIHTMKISGSCAAEKGFRLIGDTGAESACLRLCPGKYRLSGLSGSGYKSTAFALQVRKQDGSDFDQPIRAYDGTDAEFELDEETVVQIRLYVGGTVTLAGFEFTPSLVRMKDESSNENGGGSSGSLYASGTYTPATDSQFMSVTGIGFTPKCFKVMVTADGWQDGTAKSHGTIYTSGDCSWIGSNAAGTSYACNAYRDLDTTPKADNYAAIPPTPLHGILETGFFSYGANRPWKAGYTYNWEAWG